MRENHLKCLHLHPFPQASEDATRSARFSQLHVRAQYPFSSTCSTSFCSPSSELVHTLLPVVFLKLPGRTLPPDPTLS